MCSSGTSHQFFLIPRGLWAGDGGLADGFADGLGLKLRARCLSVAILVPLSFQPVGLNFNVPLEADKNKAKVRESVSYFICQAHFIPKGNLKREYGIK